MPSFVEIVRARGTLTIISGHAVDQGPCACRGDSDLCCLCNRLCLLLTFLCRRFRGCRNGDRSGKSNCAFLQQYIMTGLRIQIHILCGRSRPCDLAAFLQTAVQGQPAGRPHLEGLLRCRYLDGQLRGFQYGQFLFCDRFRSLFYSDIFRRAVGFTGFLFDFLCGSCFLFVSGNNGFLRVRCILTGFFHFGGICIDHFRFFRSTVFIGNLRFYDSGPRLGSIFLSHLCHFSAGIRRHQLCRRYSCRSQYDRQQQCQSSFHTNSSYFPTTFQCSFYSFGYNFYILTFFFSLTQALFEYL